MEIYNEKDIIHYPSLRTMLMVERVLKEADTMIDREELKRRLPVKIMHQTLNLILKYLEEKGMIIDSHKGILWIYNPSPKLRKAIENAGEMPEETNLKIKNYNVNMRKDIVKVIATILRIIKRFGVARAGIFGSYATGEANKDSDIDILIEFKGKKSLLDLVSLQLAIEQALNKKADVITYNSINPLLKKRILNEEIRIL
jgi:hypothetical protein